MSKAEAHTGKMHHSVCGYFTLDGKTLNAVYSQGSYVTREKSLET